MKIKYTGELESITLRGVTFPQEKGVDVEDESLAAKCMALPFFSEVKRGRPKKTDVEDE